MAENNTQDSTAPVAEVTQADQPGTLEATTQTSAQPSTEAQEQPASSPESQEPVTQAEPVTATPAPAPTPVSAPAPAPTPAPKVMVKEKTAVAKPVTDTSSTAQAEFDRLLGQVPAVRRAPIQRLQEYIDMMHPKRPLSVEEGVRHQVALFKTIQNVINREDEYFRPLFSAILALFDLHKAGVFHETNVFRFMDNITLPDNERKAFQRLINLIKVTAAKSSRSTAIKQVNLQDSLRFGLTDEGRQRVNDFFGANK